MARLCRKKNCKNKTTIFCFTDGYELSLCEQHWLPLQQHVNRTHPPCNKCARGNMLVRNTGDADNEDDDQHIRFLCNPYLNAIRKAFA